MSAQVIPFPAASRHGNVDRVAWQMSRAGLDEAEAILCTELRCIRDRLDRLGVDRIAIGRDLNDFEAAVRAVLWRDAQSRGGA